MRVVYGIAVLAATISALVTAAPPAIAQASDLSALFSERRTIPTPNPWPLRNLVTPGTLTVGITAKTPPSSFTNPAGEFDGSRVKLFKKLAEDLGLRIEFVRLDWPGILPGITANRFDMACEGASWSIPRMTSPDFFLTRPIAANATIAIVRTNGEVKSWNDVNGRRLGGVRGELYFTTARGRTQPSSVLELPGRPEGILALLNRQIDAFAVDMVAGRSLIANSPRGNELMIIGPPLELVVQSICVNRNSPDLLQAANILLTNYRVDGTLAAFEREYFGTDEHVQLLSVVGY